MSIKCCNCGYVHKTSDEAISAIGKIINDTVSLLRTIGKFFPEIPEIPDIPGTMSAVGPFRTASYLNIGDNALKCPKCGQTGRWVDCE